MIEYFKEQFSNIEKILYLSKIDLIKSYRGAYFGWAWAVFKPAFQIFVYYFTLVIGLKSSKDMFGYPYFLWLISGMVPWFFIRDIFQNGTDCIRKYKYLVTKVKFPVSIIPTFCTLSNFFLHLILMGIVIIIFKLTPFVLTEYMLQLPIYMTLMLVYFTFLSLLLSSLSAISKDFASFVKTITFALFWLSGIIWDISKIDITWLKHLLALNPITFIVNGYRNCFIKHIWLWEEPLKLSAFFIIMIITITLGIVIYNKVKKDIPDLL